MNYGGGLLICRLTKLHNVKLFPSVRLIACVCQVDSAVYKTTLSISALNGLLT